jgi:hypothetical protein
MPNPHFLLNLVERAVVPDVVFPPKPPPPPPKRDLKKSVQPVDPPKCHAFLQSYTGAPRSVNTANEEGNYVIIGQGFAATVNLATLLSKWGAARIGTKKIFFIGYPDPWLDYVSHNMNQEPELLTLPGYSKHPSHAPDQPAGEGGRWLGSVEFATTNRTEMERFGKKSKSALNMYVLDAAVLSIKKHERGYKIEIEGGDPIVAEMVDICTGTGQQALMKTLKDDPVYGVDMTIELWRDYLNPQALDAPGDWIPRVCAAEMYVRRNCKPKEGGAVCIGPASSPAGLQAGEHALCEDRGGGVPAAEVFLIASRDINEGFLPIGRLDYHAVTEDGKKLPWRQTNAVGKLKPTNAKVWFGDGYRIESIQPFLPDHAALFKETKGLDFAAGKLLVKFKSTTPKPLMGKDGPTTVPILYGLFDQVVLGSGRARGEAVDKEQSLGSATQLVQDFRAELVPLKVPKYDFAVGLASSDATLRILGAAGLNNPIYAASAVKNDLGLTPLGMFQRSLPVEARVNGEGVTLAAATIAIANRFFDAEAQPNRNVNTATRGELAEVAGKTVGDDVYYARHERVGPFTKPLQLGHAVQFYRFDSRRYDFRGRLEERIQSQLKVSAEIVKLEREIQGIRGTREAPKTPSLEEEERAKVLSIKLGELKKEDTYLKERIAISETNRPTFDMNDDPWLFRAQESWNDFNKRWLGEDHDDRPLDQQLEGWAEVPSGDTEKLAKLAFFYDEYIEWGDETAARKKV